MADVFFVIMRWLHFTSFITLIGGTIYSRLVMTPALAALSPDSAGAIDSRTASGFRPFVLAAVIGLILSGTYNLLTNPGHSAKYHVLLGIKLLLVAHIFASALLASRAVNQRRARQMTGIIVSGLIVIAISAYLRRIF